ncbi:TetR/AcrR family transcriptional regulator [Salinibacter altiplanensis]|uniref:TetR/AcrR family transcriptional regulator n=1 Tax=Salinibacter altiplanensis TaxID=1803181 RepID=UPI000C9FA05B|nr:TetR/AcrR family transcriptional regulator [Salinibacter altiplanensis]
MPVDNPQREKKRQRRQTIVDAADTVLKEKGRDAMTMADIADAAELSRSLLYVYFEDMDDIVLAVTHRGFRSMRERFEAAARQHETGRAQIRAIGDAYLQFSQEEPTRFRLVAQFESRVADPEDSPERVRHCLVEADRGLQVMSTAIRRGIDDGSIRSTLNPRQAALTLWGSTHGLIQLAATKGGGLEKQYGLDPGSLVDTGLDFLGRALADLPAKDLE